ncbi:MAG: hypothetical protein SVS85_00495, partial [Candidatus Nanohaloarchaea archaeon]|nr:hypothetical protein [Candidatus Nanohaloarchaea archaeon]
SFSSDRRKVEAGEEQAFYIPASLDRIDLRVNDRIEVVLNYGEREELLVNSRSESIRLSVSRGILTPRFVRSNAPVTAALVLLLAGIVLWRRESVLRYVERIR